MSQPEKETPPMYELTVRCGDWENTNLVRPDDCRDGLIAQEGGGQVLSVDYFSNTAQVHLGEVVDVKQVE